MSSKKKKKKGAPAAKSAPTAKSKPPPPPPRMIIRRNAAPRRPMEPRTEESPTESERVPLTKRVEAMDASHVAAGAVGGALGSVAGVVVAGKGWIGPKTAAGLLMGAGAVTSAAGWYWEADHLMLAGMGLTAAGAISMTNQLAVDGYEAYEERAEEKREKQEKERKEEDRARRLAEARALLEAEAKSKQEPLRNGRRIVVVDADGEVIEQPEHAAA